MFLINISIIYCKLGLAHCVCINSNKKTRDPLGNVQVPLQNCCFPEAFATIIARSHQTVYHRPDVWLFSLSMAINKVSLGVAKLFQSCCSFSKLMQGYSETAIWKCFMIKIWKTLIFIYFSIFIPSCLIKKRKTIRRGTFVSSEAPRTASDAKNNRYLSLCR